MADKQLSFKERVAAQKAAAAEAAAVFDPVVGEEPEPLRGNPTVVDPFDPLGLGLGGGGGDVGNNPFNSSDPFSPQSNGGRATIAEPAPASSSMNPFGDLLPTPVGATPFVSDDKFPPPKAAAQPKAKAAPVPVAQPPPALPPKKAAPAPSGPDNSTSSSSFNPFFSETGSAPAAIPAPATTISSPVTAKDAAPVTDSERAKFKQQISSLLNEKAALQDQLDRVRHAEMTAQDPRVVVAALQKGHRSALSEVKGLAAKEGVLAEAVHSGDGDTVTFITLWLEDTLEKQLFMQLLTKYRLALLCYERYLRERRRLYDLIALYRYMKAPRREMCLRLKENYRNRDPQRRLEALQRSLNFLNTEPLLDQERAFVQEAWTLLERQMKVEGHDATVAAAGTEEIYQLHPRRNIIFSPLAFTTHYCLVYHPYADKSKLSSPAGLKLAFQMSDRTFQYLALKARAKVGDWETIKKLPKQKGVFKKELVTDIGFRLFVEVLCKHRAPKELVIFMANNVKPAEEKYGVAMRFRLYDIAIDALVELRDQVKLVELRNYLVEEHGAQASIDLRNRIDRETSNKKIKWKHKVPGM